MTSSFTFAGAYLPRLQSYQDEIVQRLETLVNIDSGTGQVEGVNRIAAHLEAWLSAAGFSITLHPTKPFGNNLLARRRGAGHARILLVGHIDTVYPPGSARVHPFSLQNGIAHGPGVIDMKSGVLMGLYALRVLIEDGFEDYGELSFFINNDEEVGSAGSKALMRDIARYVDYGLVLEPTRDVNVITHARKGADRYVLEVRGIPAHSGADPHNGRSAVVELAHKIIAIHNLHSIFPGITFNVTRLNSSELLNVVPDTARCHISVRAFSQRGLDRAAAALEQIAAGSSIPDTSATLTRTVGRTPYEATPEVMQLVELAKSEGEALGLNLISEGKGGVSDANLLMEIGVPTLDSLGPAGGHMHNLAREHLHLASLAPRGALLAGLIRRLCLLKSTGPQPPV
ncbi:MAG: M20 family metallopeptidase [Ktedonobacteraceae bacterium]|nr:M20 family metallopeptidase [Ktedonobacteraceae bacterium]